MFKINIDDDNLNIDESIKENNLQKNKKSDINKEKSSSIYKPIFRCTECCLIPWLILKEKDNKISINCPNNHRREMSINEYMEKGLLNGINNIICSDCGSKPEPKKRFKFCGECIKIFCKNCLKKHNNTPFTSGHETISIKKMDTFCYLHKSRFTHYCQICHRNICKNCFYLHNNHQILSLKEIKLSKEEIKELKEDLIKENNIINEITEIFKNTIKSIEKKFEDVINNKKLIIKFKKIIEDIYEKKDSNFQIIENMNRLKFNTESLYLENDMNELDILFEIFNYLNCIDYNVDNIPISINESTDKNSSIKTNKLYNRKKFMSNDINNYIQKENNEFIYERKHKKIFSNFIHKKEEEKNEEKNSSKSINNKLLNNTDDKYSINSKEDKNNKKYSKKRIKERIIYQRPSEENKEKRKDFYLKLENNYKLLNDSNNINIDQTPKKNYNIINQFKIEEDDRKNKKEICPKFEEEDEDESENNKINTFDDIVFNNELKKINIKNEIESSEKNIQKSSKNVKKNKLKDKIKKRGSKDNIKEERKNGEQGDELNENLFNKTRDKSKEKRIKIKKENLAKSQDINQSNYTFNKQIFNLTDNDFEYTYEFNKEKHLNLTNIFNKAIENSNIKSKTKLNNKNKQEDSKNENFEELEKKIITSNEDKENKNIISEYNRIENNISNNKSYENNVNDESNEERSINNYKEKKTINIKDKKKKNIKKKKIRKINIMVDELSFDELSNHEKNDKYNINSQKEPDIQNEMILNKENINENDLRNNILNKNNKEEKTNTNSNKEEDTKINESFSPSPPPKIMSKSEVDSNPKKDKVKTKKVIKKVKKAKKKKEDLAKSFDDIKNTSNNLENKKIQRSNSFDIINYVSEFEITKKVNSMKFDIGISCLLELSNIAFAAGNLNGDIKIIDRSTFKEIQTIKEHTGTINSLIKLKDGSILSVSADKSMKKIILSENYLYYTVEFIFDGYDNYVIKAIELSNKKIISCSWDNLLFLWEEKNNTYINSLKFNENQRVEDILEISKNKFCSLSENELKIWDSNTLGQLHSIKLQRGITSNNSLCKVNDEILISIFYNAIHLIDLVNFNLINTINMDQGNLSCITKLNDGSILIAEDLNTDKYCLFYLKQYILEGDELQYISFKKDKFFKINKNNDKEIRALIQFSDGIIAEGIAGEFNEKDSGDIFFYE